MKSVRDGAGIVLREIDSARFTVSQVGSIHLSSFIAEHEDLDDAEVVGTARATQLAGIMRMLEHLIFAEAQTKFHYIATERRYNIKYLLESPEKLFSSETFASLPDLCRSDFAESCKCIAYELPTAAAFHMLRATEGAVKQLYLCYVKQKRVKILTWGNMISHLSKRSRNKPPHVLLEALDYIRESYRNPTNHPEATYTTSSAEDFDSSFL